MFNMNQTSLKIKGVDFDDTSPFSNFGIITRRKELSKIAMTKFLYLWVCLGVFVLFCL